MLFTLVEVHYQHNFIYIADDILDDDQVEVPIGFTLLQPGGTLDISALVKSRKYKERGNKTGLVKACKRLQEMGLGELCELGSMRGTPMVRMCNNQINHVAYKSAHSTSMIQDASRMVLHQ